MKKMINHLNHHRRCHRVIQQQRVCCYSHSFSTSNDSGTNCSRNLVPKALYRQLLSWCRRNTGIPFSPLPPLTLASPQVNLVALKRLKEMRSFLVRNSSDDLDGNNHIRKFRQNSHPAHYAMYKEGIVVKDNLITFPEIRDANELRSVIRSVYWLNNEQTRAIIVNVQEEDNFRRSEDDEQKSQISLAFEAIKSFNELSSNELHLRREKRKKTIECRNMKENAPLFHVGEVVKHKKANWRGVIVGWDIDEPNNRNQDRLSSLTSKKYKILEATSNADRNEETPLSKAMVKYTILVDMNDSSLLHTSKSISLESQDDLIPVDEPCLRRIHNNLINQYFSKFDPNKDGYIPNKVLNYAYPLDRFTEVRKEEAEKASDYTPQNTEPKLSPSPKLQDVCTKITSGIQHISHRLLPPVLELKTHQKNDDSGTISLASTLLSSLQSMSLENERRFFHHPLHLAISSVKKLSQFHAKLNTLQWSHNNHKKCNSTINFKLGQTVRHNLFDCRGVVTAWDPKPYHNSSFGDASQPFFHIIPDVNDCIREFGSPRSWLYVRQDNLEPYDLKQGRIELEMELDAEEWGWNKENSWFSPSEEIKVSLETSGTIICPLK